MTKKRQTETRSSTVMYVGQDEQRPGWYFVAGGKGKWKTIMVGPYTKQSTAVRMAKRYDKASEEASK
jgi:hypothetical protein